MSQKYLEALNESIPTTNVKATSVEPNEAVPGAISVHPDAAWLKGLKDAFSDILACTELIEPDVWKDKCGADKEATLSLQGKHKAKIIAVAAEEYFSVLNKTKYGLRSLNGEVPYFYNGKYWKAIDKTVLKNHLTDVATKLGLSRLSVIYWKNAQELYNQVMLRCNSFTMDDLSDRVKLNLNNCTLEIEEDGSVKPREHSKDDLLFYCLPYDYEPTATAPRFQKWLDRVQTDAETQAIMAEYVGYLFAPSIKLQKILFLYGAPSTGKSVFNEVLKYLLGEANIEHQTLAQLTAEKGYYRAKLKNVLLNTCSDLSRKGIQDDGIFKKLAADEPLDIEVKYGEPTKLYRYARLIFNINEFIYTKFDEAIFRRFLIAEFDAPPISDDEKDPYLADRIGKEEMSGVLNWALEGLKRIRKNKSFSKCRKAEKALNRFKRSCDSVSSFLMERDEPLTTYIEAKKFYVNDENGLHNALETFATKELFDEFKRYCAENNCYNLSRNVFYSRLEALGFRKRSMGGRREGFECYKMPASWDPDTQSHVFDAPADDLPLC